MDSDKFKKLISFLESSGGKDTDHKLMGSGMHKGTSAMGEYGMMPNTAQQMAKTNIRDNKNTPLDEVVANIDPSQVEEVLSDNPGKTKEYVNAYMDKVLSSSDSMQDAATKWMTGPNASKDTMSRVNKKNPGRLEKLRQFMDNYKPAPQTLEDLIPSDEKETLMSKIRGK